MSRVHPTSQESDILIDDAALHSWKRNQLADAEGFMTAATHGSRNLSHYVLASRALVIAGLQQWDAAIADATEVCIALHSTGCHKITSSPSILSHPSLATLQRVYPLSARGKSTRRACDIALERNSRMKPFSTRPMFWSYFGSTRLRARSRPVPS